MANRYRNLIYSTAEYTHSYNGFRGIELNASSISGSQSRLAYAQNVYKDYDGDGADVLESVPGFRCFADHGRKIHALYYQRSPFGNEDHILVHAADKLIRHPLSDTGRGNASGEEIATVCDTKSFGFEYGRHFYVMDTEKILQIGDDGVATVVGDDGAKPYVPTRYVSGEEYEQRNLLTDSFREEYCIGDPTAYLFATEGLKYIVTDPNLRYCSVVGLDDTDETEIYVPAYVSISGVPHKVMSIGENAFANKNGITAVYISEGVTSISKRAFLGCTALQTVATPSTVLRIDEKAFYGCVSLSTLYLGASLTYIGADAVKSCRSLTHVDYALGESDFNTVQGHEVMSAQTLRAGSSYDTVKIALPLHDEVESVSSVTLDNEECQWDTVSENGMIKSVTIVFPSLADATDTVMRVTGTLTPLGEEWVSDMSPLADTTPYLAIVSSGIAEVFDGRIFFSGNPLFPNTVFYTERPKQGEEGALYVGRYNYFNDGVGSYKVKSMLAVRDMLAVFKEGDDGSGSIFYHSKAAGTGIIDTVYPVSYVHSGICSKGSCRSFLDDPVFLTDEGLMALNSENISYQRNVVCRSHNVNYALLKEDLSRASLCEWLGYLAVGVEGKIFLADSRSVFTHATGSHEYDWFLLTDIGAYRNDTRVYRYSPDAYRDAVAHPTRIGEAADREAVYSETDADGISYAYVYENGTKYRVVKTDELAGGDFSHATVFTSHGKLLFFATDDGHICVFNNDMRGIAPDSVKSSPEYNEAQYLAEMGHRLHPFFYSFAGHAPRYVIKTALDDCGVPHLTKNTVKKSLVVKAKSTVGDAIRCEVKTDARNPVYVGSFPAASGGFDSFSFEAAPWYVGRYSSVALPENEKRWIEKQITLIADGFEAPIAIYSISYRYTIKGKIKNNA